MSDLDLDALARAAVTTHLTPRCPACLAEVMAEHEADCALLELSYALGSRIPDDEEPTDE
jgi:hypothetical protein